MKERPILFSGPMVKAIREDRKTQTRRVGKVQCPKWVGLGVSSIGHATKGTVIHATYDAFPGKGTARWAICEFPYGLPGDLLYVKESAWMWCERRPNGTTPKGRQKWAYIPMRNAPVVYCADRPAKPETDIVTTPTGNHWGWRKKIGRFLPRWASRITLEITGVRVERLNEISDFDAFQEGVKDEPGTITGPYCRSFVQGFKNIWESINGPGSWDENPWVWVIEFRRVNQ